MQDCRRTIFVKHKLEIGSTKYFHLFEFYFANNIGMITKKLTNSNENVAKQRNLESFTYKYYFLNYHANIVCKLEFHYIKIKFLGLFLEESSGPY